MIYQAVGHCDYSIFKDSVNELLNQGWICQGGIYLAYNAEGKAVKYFQAMVHSSKKDTRAGLARLEKELFDPALGIPHDWKKMTKEQFLALPNRTLTKEQIAFFDLDMEHIMMGGT